MRTWNLSWKGEIASHLLVSISVGLGPWQWYTDILLLYEVGVSSLTRARSVEG